jgi:hypothetical protein
MDSSSSSATNQSIQQYLAQLDDIQKKAHDIAKQHLGTSYNIAKSNGYMDWLKQQSQPQKTPLPPP